MPFRDRAEAGEQLARKLARYKGEEAVVFALPRGGVIVAAPIAEELKAPLDLILVRKIGVPYQPELAMGAIADSGKAVTVRNEDIIRLAAVSEDDFNATAAAEREEIERRRKAYLGDRPPPDVSGKVAIVVDDGVATGATTKAALRAMKARGPKKLVLAIPVAPTDTLSELRAEADDIVCLEDHRDFGAIGFFYLDFRQVSDDEVVSALSRFAKPKDQGGAA
jgi:predicted phosphoribosyltransferase